MTLKEAISIKQRFNLPLNSIVNIRTSWGIRNGARWGVFYDFKQAMYELRLSERKIKSISYTITEEDLRSYADQEDIAFKPGDVDQLLHYCDSGLSGQVDLRLILQGAFEALGEK